jgi:hypothetical protein
VAGYAGFVQGAKLEGGGATEVQRRIPPLGHDFAKDLGVSCPPDRTRNHPWPNPSASRPVRQFVDRHNLIHSRVFGSVLTGTDTDESDLDLLVDPVHELSR